jgi:AraC-like DNA-binding protein
MAAEPDFWRPEAAAGFPFHVAFECLRLRDGRRHRIAPHLHPHVELLLIERGRYRGLVAGEAVEVVPGRALLVAPGDLHEDRCDAPVRFRCLTLRLLPGERPGRSAQLLADAVPVPARVLDAAAAAGLAAVAERIAVARARDDAYLPFELDALAFAALCVLLRALPPALLHPRLVGQAARHRFARELEALFAGAPDGGLSLADLARGMGLAPRTLTARCAAELGASPARLYVRFRMERARQLLRDSAAPVAAVAAALGYANPFHFSTVYKRVHGLPPGQDRG